jgi:hypothetical protein
MIIDDRHRAAFVHIPKCGGTSISLQLSELDSYGGRFRNKGRHPELGSVHFAHIPLTFLRAAFPDVFAKVAAYQSFALTRDPHDRFASAVFQRLEEFRGVRKTAVTSQMALAEAREVIAWLTGRGPFCDLDYIHFSRQIDYVRLDGHGVVGNVFAIETMDEMTRGLGEVCQVSLDPERRENTNFASGNRFLAMAHLAKPIYSRLTTWALRERMLHLLRRWDLQNPRRLYEALRADGSINRFVETYYAMDFTLHASGRAAVAVHDDGAGRVDA